MTRVYKKLIDIQERLEVQPLVEVYDEGDDSAPSSNITQDPGVEPGSLQDHEMDDAAQDPQLEPGSVADHDMKQGLPLDPDMSAYKHDPFERHEQVDSLKDNQRILEELKKIISESMVHKDERLYYPTEWFAESSNKVSVWRK